MRANAGLAGPASPWVWPPVWGQGISLRQDLSGL